MKSISQRVLAVLLSFVILSASIMSCASTTLLTSKPPGADIYINGKLKGTTPYKRTDMAISGSQKTIEIYKEGYDDFRALLTKKGRVHVGALITGVFLLVPFIWIVQYDLEYVYELTPSNDNYRDRYLPK